MLPLDRETNARRIAGVRDSVTDSVGNRWGLILSPAAQSDSASSLASDSTAQARDIRTMNSPMPARVSAGLPTGAQFAPDSHLADAAVDLSEAA